LLWNTLAAFAGEVALDILMIPRYGILGAAIVAGVVFTVVNLIQVWQVWHRARIHPFSTSLGKTLLAAGLGYAASLPFTHGHLEAGFARAAAGSCAALLIYAIALMKAGLDMHTMLAWKQERQTLFRRLGLLRTTVPERVG
jgi:O-antigen/teichoic acid export membrane protein